LVPQESLGDFKSRRRRQARWSAAAWRR